MKLVISVLVAMVTLVFGMSWQLAVSETRDSRYLNVEIGPKFNDKDELLQPVGFRTWIFLGAPLTPNALMVFSDFYQQLKPLPAVAE